MTSNATQRHAARRDRNTSEGRGANAALRKEKRPGKARTIE